MAALANRQRRRKIQAFALVKMSSFTGSGPLVPGNLPTPALAISREQHAFVILGRSRSEATRGDPGIHAVTSKLPQPCRTLQRCTTSPHVTKPR
ncbi:protein of unknown function [Aminobacter niigataensis]|nr:protein of unknown function [Aminobacter niigataensis]